MATIRGILLDVDGTLVDSNDAHAHSWVKAFARSGIEVPFEKVRPLIGMGGDKVLATLANLSDESPLGKQIIERRQTIFQDEYLPSIRPFPKVRELLSRMHADGLKLIVATSAKEKELGGLLKATGAEDLIRDSTTSDDAENSKPDPDIIAAALKKSGLPAAQVFMLGDTPYDVEAANRADVSTIALLCGGWSDLELAGALAVYKDPQDLLENYDTSPLGSARS